MATLQSWVALLLQNSKVVVGSLLVLLSALGFTTFTAVEQHQELAELRTVIVEIPVEVPVNAKEHNHDHSHKQIAKNEAEIKQLKSTVNQLKAWH